MTSVPGRPGELSSMGGGNSTLRLFNESIVLHNEAGVANE